MSKEVADAVKTVASKIGDLGNIGREIDNLKRAVEALTSELKEVKKFAEVKNAIGDSNDTLAKIHNELRQIREKL
jgi:hypothetical protein